MRIEERKVTIPAKTYIEKVYVASDGKCFTSEDSCLWYEKDLENKQHPVYINAIKNICAYDKTEDETFNATLYYFSNEEDYKFFLNSQNIKTNRVDKYGCSHKLESDFKEYGVGWYICWNYAWGDYSDIYHIKNYNNYIDGIEKEWQYYKNGLKIRISEKEEEMKKY